MFEALPVEVQVYITGMFLGVAIPLVIFWLLNRPLREFLKEIFHSPPVEQFWVRVVLLGFLVSTLSVALVFRPLDPATTDDVALFFNVADNCKQMLDGLIFSMLVIFLPLLAAYTILHVPRRMQQPGGEESSACQKS